MTTPIPPIAPASPAPPTPPKVLQLAQPTQRQEAPTPTVPAAGIGMQPEPEPRYTRPTAPQIGRHTSEPSHANISYAVFCLKKKSMQDGCCAMYVYFSACFEPLVWGVAEG